MKYCFATAKIRTIFISSKFLEEKTQKDGILGERGLIENAVFHVPIKMLKPFGGYKIIVYLRNV